MEKFRCSVNKSSIIMKYLFYYFAYLFITHLFLKGIEVATLGYVDDSFIQCVMVIVLFLLKFFFFVFFYYYFLNFILFLNFTMLYQFCQISKWIRHRYTCVPHPEPSSLLPPRTIPLGHPSAPAPSIQYPASNLDWQLISYMILYMFQCHSPKSSRPLPLQHSP